jgi:lysophospholipase L1-like esterase
MWATYEIFRGLTRSLRQRTLVVVKNTPMIDFVRVLALAAIFLPAVDGFSQQAEPKKKARKTNPVLAKIEDDPALPRVLLVGDSISLGYTLATRERLQGKANLHRIPTNSGHTGMGIAGLPKWLKTDAGKKWDVIHFNFGLWDLCYRNPESKTQGNRDKVNGTQTHTIEQYVANLETIVAELQTTGAALIFATTTPVPEGELGRKMGDDLRFNEAALKVMEKHGIAINDLHAVMAGKMKDYAKAPGDVHFTAEGSALLADQVAAAIEARLPGKVEARVLFDGSNFDQWTLDQEGGWVIDDEGAMTCLMGEVVDSKTGKKKVRGLGNIWSKETYRDFELTVDYKLSEGANSGVFYRCDKNDYVQGGFEIQLMDNVGFQKTHGEKDARKLNGSFYDCLAPKADPQNPIGEWNTMTLRCEGPNISLTINGTETFSVDVNDWDTPLKNPDGTTNKFKIARKDASRVGYIGLQNHGQVVWFRDVKIKRL